MSIARLPQFLAGIGEKRPTLLEDLVHRMRRRSRRQPRRENVAVRTEEEEVTPAAVAEMEVDENPVPVPVRKSSKRVKVDAGAGVARTVRRPLRRCSTVTSETESERSIPQEGDLPGPGEQMDYAEEIGRGLSSTYLRSISSDSGPEGGASGARL